MTAIAAQARARLDIGQVLGKTFDVLGRNLIPFGLLSIVMTGFPALLSGYAQMGRYKALLAAGVHIGPRVGANMGGPGPIGLVAFALSVFLIPIFFAAIVRATITDLDGGRADLAAFLKMGLRNWLGVALVWILMLLGLMTASILLFVPGVILWAIWVVALPAQVMEDLGPVKALKRSAQLTKGHRWSIFLLGLVTGVIAVAIEFGLFAVAGGMLQMLASPVGLILMPLLTAAFNLLGFTGLGVLYHQLRTLRDGPGVRAIGEVFA